MVSPFTTTVPCVKASACIVPCRAIAWRAMAVDAGTSAQRIRYGLTGLAIAFLVVLLGSVISRASRDNSPPATNEMNVTEPSEPMAQLGVAPGAERTDNSSSNKQ